MSERLCAISMTAYAQNAEKVKVVPCGRNGRVWRNAELSRRSDASLLLSFPPLVVATHEATA